MGFLAPNLTLLSKFLAITAFLASMMTNILGTFTDDGWGKLGPGGWGKLGPGGWGKLGPELIKASYRLGLPMDTLM